MASSRYNALYGPEEILNYGMLMCSGNVYSENAGLDLKSAQLEQGMGLRVPTPQWLNSRLRTRSIDEMRRVCNNMTDSTIQAALGAGLLTGRLMFGMDKHNHACHDDPPDKTNTVRTPHERGTSCARSFTAQTVGTEAPLTVWCDPVCPGEPLHYFVRQTIVQMVGFWILTLEIWTKIRLGYELAR